MTEPYPEQQHPRRRRVRGYARAMELPDVEHHQQQQPYGDRLTEEDEALLGYPDVAPDRLRSSLVRRRAPFQGGDDDVDVLNIIVTPRGAPTSQQDRTTTLDVHPVCHRHRRLREPTIAAAAALLTCSQRPLDVACCCIACTATPARFWLSGWG